MTNANAIILLHIKSLAQNNLRVYVVFDVYYEDSLKSETRMQVTGKVTGSNRPPQWNENKTELFICSR